MSKVELVVLGDPLGKQRPRVSMANGIIRTYTPQKTINYESLIAHEYMSKYQKRQFEVDEPISAIVKIYFGLNKGDYGKKGLNKSGREKLEQKYSTNKVDIDNILKSIFDALNSICYHDDKQIAQVYAMKLFTQDSPRVEITLESLLNESWKQDLLLLWWQWFTCF